MKKKTTWVRAILVSFIAACVFTACYGVFRNKAKDYVSDPTNSENNIAWLYESCYMLYKDMYNTVNGTQAGYRDIYLEPQEGFQWILDEQKLNQYLEMLQNTSGMDDTATEIVSELEAPTVVSPSVTESTQDVIQIGYLENVEGMLGDLERFEQYYANLESYYENLNYMYGYHVVDHATGRILTNLTVNEIQRADNIHFQLSFEFDEAGNVSVGETVIASDTDLIRRLANGEIRQIGSLNPVTEEVSSLKNYVSVMKPVGCTITYFMTKDTWENRRFDFQVLDYGRGQFEVNRIVDNSSLRYIYKQAGAGSVLSILLLVVGILGFLLTGNGQAVNFKNKKNLFTSIEFLVLAGLFLFGFGDRYILKWIADVAEGDATSILTYAINGRGFVANTLVYSFNLLILTIFFCAAWYIGYCVGGCKDKGLRIYLQEHGIIYRIFPYVKRKCKEAYTKVSDIDLTKNANKTIIWLLVINGIILLAISSLWLVGWIAVIVYSLILYVVLKKYISDLQKRYGILLNATNEIAKGNLNVNIEENLGVFEPFKPEITKIQEGFKNAVEQEVKSQRMKSELITNVSHDLKTPLTAIITYINLLKEKNLTEEQRTEYLDTLERKSLRLKVLIEDLFEVSKANSNNMTLNIMDVDIMNLVKQVSFEMSDKLEAAGLDVRLNLPEGRITLPLDSQKTYRVYENLFVNVAKYAMPGTRVYVSGALRDGCVEIILKNITAQEITVDSQELTERFVRNDSSRNTEGSGLGLAIAKSFMELQGGSLKVEVDGDLFKATTVWPLTDIQA